MAVPGRMFLAVKKTIMKVGNIMDGIKKLLEGLPLEFSSLKTRNPDDYMDSSGILICGKCHTSKQSYTPWPGYSEPILVPSLCSCEKAKQNEEEATEKVLQIRGRIESLRRNGLTDPAYLKWTFDKDDMRQPDISKVSKKYVDEWVKMKHENVGLLFYGDVGTGKSFCACAIANALLEKCVPVLVTNFPRILNKLQSSGWGTDRNEVFDRIQDYALVVIDDLGVERNTSFAMEQVYNVIDARYRSGKPLIVTTNLAPMDIKRPENIALERIYDRILECCIPVKLTGVSRRAEVAENKRNKYKELLGI